jgi:NTE family protein
MACITDQFRYNREFVSRRIYFSMSKPTNSLASLLLVLLAGCASTRKAPPVDVPVAPLPQVQAQAQAQAQAIAPAVRPVRIGLALGGGAARGFAHIGVIKALEAQGIVPDIVVGTSAGSVVGAMYAAGNNGFQLNRMALEMDEAAMSDWAIPLFARSSGVLKGEAIQRYVNRAVRSMPIEKFPKAFGAVATDLNTGKPILFQRGNAGMAVRASSSVPGVFQPVKIGSHSYVDGGLVAPVPVRYAREMGADFVIAVNISADPDAQPATSNLDVVLQTFAIMGQTINRLEMKDADVVITPSLGAMKGNDFGGRNLAILAGEQATAAVLPDLRAKLKAKRESASTN